MSSGFIRCLMSWHFRADALQIERAAANPDDGGMYGNQENRTGKNDRRRAFFHK